MSKVGKDYIIQQYEDGAENYAKYTTNIGLWSSERHVFTQYLSHDDKILDLGCGAGRTTYGLRKLGYHKLLGVDLTAGMIKKAKMLHSHFATQVNFEVGDATQLKQGDHSFDAVIFSFNGLMSIPRQENRLKAMKEVYRVLKEGGIFIFTTHDREADTRYLPFWEEEKKKWEEGKQRKDIHDYGDIIVYSEGEGRDIFVHITDKAEVTSMLKETGFHLIEEFYRPDRFEESDAVKAHSGPCRFWIVKK
ncbi:MAG: class I SAM-dependent methyltransferase [Bacteroidota bacterium]